MISDQKVSKNSAKEILAESFGSGKDPETIAAERGLYKDDNQNGLEDIVNSVIAENEKVVAEYKAGKMTAIQYLVGQAMKKSRGAGDPGVIRESLEQKIGSQP